MKTKYIYILCKKENELVDIYGIFDSFDKIIKDLKKDFYGSVIPKDISEFQSRYKISDTTKNEIVIKFDNKPYFVVYKDELNKSINDTKPLILTDAKIKLKKKR